jgi:[histone H3]-lysine36 N-dimethyltransferase SETMAR
LIDQKFLINELRRCKLFICSIIKEKNSTYYYLVTRTYFLFYLMIFEQVRVCILYEFKLGRNVTQTFNNICKAWGKNVISKRNVQQWFKKFRSGYTNLQDESRSGRPPTIDNSVLKSLIESNPRQTTRELAVILNTNNRTVCNHLQQIGKVKKLGQWVPHELSEKNKNQRLSICSSLLLRYEKDPFLERIITCDEKWILYDNSRRLGEWLDKATPPGKIPKKDINSKKIMVIIW